MHDYFSQLLLSVVFWLCWGLFYEFMFRRSNDAQKRAVAKYAALFWIGIGVWMTYNLVMWLRSP
jgi:hypothetical protein